ncbi:hypothetical protein ACTA71_009800 [Dictyostelium dimigraforme]
MIDSKDLATLLSLLDESDKPFETIATTFYRTFSKNDHFKVGCAIYTIIKDGFIRIPSQRLIGFYILFSLYKPDSSILSSNSLSSSSILTPSSSSSTVDQNSSSSSSSSSSSPSSSSSTVPTNATSQNTLSTLSTNTTSQAMSPSSTSSSSTISSFTTATATTTTNITNTTPSPTSTAITIIENVNDYPIAFNPFLPIFIDELEKQIDLSISSPLFNPIEKQILPLFLTNLPKDFSKKTPKEIINIGTNNTANTTTTISITTATTNVTLPNISISKSSLREYKNFYLERLPNHCFPSFRSIGTSQNILFRSPSTAAATTTTATATTMATDTTTATTNIPTATTINTQSKPSLNTIKNHDINSEELSFFSFEPHFKRTEPPTFNPVTTSWINPSINHGLLLSNPMTSTIAASSSSLPTTAAAAVAASSTTTTTASTTATASTSYNSKKIVRDLMTKAIKGRLKRNQILQIKNEMDIDPKLALYSGLTPKNLPFLVENNTQVAIDTLLKLINAPDFKDHFQTLISMEMNFRSMEVVNALATSVDLPSHFIPMYITNCIDSCNNIKDKAMQQRSVRLVCVFIQSLIRNNIINIKNLFSEVQSFCLEFSKIREAISLFKAINDNNSNNTNNNNSNNTNNNNLIHIGEENPNLIIMATK